MTSSGFYILGKPENVARTILGLPNPMTDPTLPPLGDYDNPLIQLNLSNLTPDDVLAALPQLTSEQQLAWQQALSSIRAGIMTNNDARTQVAMILANIGAVARSVGMILTIA